MEYNVPQKGLNLDVSSSQEGSYPFALNAQIESFTDETSFPYLSNTPSNELCANYPDKIIGTLAIQELNTFILFGNNKIYSLKNCVLTTLVEATCLNFSNKINAVYKLTDETLNLYFVDGFNEDRYIQFDRSTLQLLDEFKKNYAENCTISFQDELDCNKTKFYPEIEYPCISTNVVDGGSKKAGVYEYGICYATSKGDELSTYISFSTPIHLFDINKSFDSTDYNTNKAIQVQINNLDGSRYKYYNIICIESINEITTYLLKGTFPINNTVTYTDTDNQGIGISQSSIFQKYPYYKNSKLITVANNILLKADVKEFEKFNLQSVVNRIDLEWISGKLKLGDYAKSDKYRGYLRDEVYSFGIKFILDNLEETPVYILSSRVATASDRQLINNTDGFGERWKVYNTADIIETKDETYAEGGCIAIYQTGKFAYWESTEVYPSNGTVWGSLCGQKIRHFKFPDNSLSPHFKGDIIHPLGVKISDDTNIPNLLNDAVQIGLITQEQRNRIKGWKLLRGNRVNNKSIVAKGLLYDMWSYEKPLSEGECSGVVKQKYYYPNYPFNDLRDDTLLSSTKQHYDYYAFESNLQAPTPQHFVNENKYTFHSPDTSFVNPTLGTKLVLEGEVHGLAQGWFNESELQAKQKLLSKKHYELAFLYAKFIADTSDDGSWEQGASLGGSIGTSLFSTIKLPGIGSALGSLVGGVVGSNFAKYSISNYLYKSTIQLNQAERFLTLLKLASKDKNYSYQYQAIGNYNNWIGKAGDGKKIREIKNSGYLQSDKVNINGTLINNLYKESSVYLDVQKEDLLIPPTTQDVSRFDLTTITSTLATKCFTWTENRFTQPFKIIITFANQEKLTVVNSEYFDENGDPIQDSNGGDISYAPNYCYALSFEFVYGIGNINVITSDDLTAKSCNCGNTYSSEISSWYGSIKQNNINQYKSVYDIQWLELGSCITKIPKVDDSLLTIGDIEIACNTNTCETVFFGGDTFIGNFSFKRKHHFFSNTAYNLPLGTDIYFSDLANIAYPTYFYNTQYIPNNIYLDSLSYPFNSGSSNQSKHRYFGSILTGWRNSGFANGILGMKNFLKAPNFYLDCFTESNNYFNFSVVEGKQYTYYYGIVNVIVESDINLDLRYAKNNLEGDFYPHQSNVANWLQEKTVSPKEDNTYFYNRTYSKQQTQGANFLNDVNFRGNEDVKITHPTRVIYSSQATELDDNDVRDNFLIYKALDLHDFSLSNGKLTTIKEIEGNKVLVGFENQLQLFNSYLEINTNADTALISAGNLFKQKPVEFSKSDIGYLGTQHNIINSTPYGHVLIDAKRGQIFLVRNNAGKVDEISNKGLKHWFKNNLPFNLDIGNSIDNSFSGIGLAVCFDKRFDMLYITKLDYKPKQGVIYLNEKFYFGNTEIQLTDKTYFEDVSWTCGYNFLTQSWISWYSFKPLYYLEGVHKFYSGITNGVWKHNVEGNYQKFYGKLNPFIVELKTKNELNYKLLKSCTYYLDVLEYKNKNKHYLQNIGFNKAIIYNNHQNTGLLELEYREKNVVTNKYPDHQSNKTVLGFTKVENKYNFGGFIDKSKGGWQWLFDGNNVSKRLNMNNLDFYNKLNNSYIRGDVNYIRLINDKSTNHFIFKGLIDNSINSI